MKCPNCDFIEKDEAFGQPPTCPKCGAIYEKALIARAARDRLAKKAETRRAKESEKAAEEEQLEAQDQSKEEKPSLLARGLEGAKQGVTESRAQRNSQGLLLYTADGQPVVIKAERKPGCLKPIMIAIAAIFIISTVTQCADSYQKNTGRTTRAVSSTDAARAEREREISRQYRAERIVKNGLKDSGSAKFRNQKGVCGEVNAKNSFGAYTGFKRYVVIDSELFFTDDGTGEFEELWDRLCVQSTPAPAQQRASGPAKLAPAEQALKTPAAAPAPIEKKRQNPTADELRAAIAPMVPGKEELILGFQPKLTVVRWSADSSVWRMAEISQSYSKSSVSKAVAITDCKDVYAWMSGLSQLDFLNKNFTDKFQFLNYKEFKLQTRVRDYICE